MESQNHHTSVRLKLVAYLFMLIGALSLLAIVISFIQQRPRLNVGVLALLIGVGLLRHNRSALFWAKLVTWFILITSVISFPIAVFAGQGAMYAGLYGIWHTEVSRWLFTILGAASIGLNIWVVTIFANKDVQELFY